MPRHLPEEGSQKRFCEAKDFLGKGDAGVKSAAVAVRRSLACAPCGDAVTPSVAVSDSTTLPSCLRQATVSAAQGKRRLGQGNAPSNGAFPSSKAVKAPPGLCQESAFSPLTQGRLTCKRFFGKRRRRREKRSGCRKAIARICALRRRGDSLSLAALDSSLREGAKGVSAKGVSAV